MAATDSCYPGRAVHRMNPDHQRPALAFVLAGEAGSQVELPCSVDLTQLVLLQLVHVALIELPQQALLVRHAGHRGPAVAPGPVLFATEVHLDPPAIAIREQLRLNPRHLDQTERSLLSGEHRSERAVGMRPHEPRSVIIGQHRRHGSSAPLYVPVLDVRPGDQRVADAPIGRRWRCRPRTRSPHSCESHQER